VKSLDINACLFISNQKWLKIKSVKYKLCEIDTLKKWNDIKPHTKNNHSFFSKWMPDCFYISPEGFPSASKDKLHKKGQVFINLQTDISIVKRGKCLNNTKRWSEWQKPGD